jgi:hypothetical protein
MVLVMIKTSVFPKAYLYNSLPEEGNMFTDCNIDMFAFRLDDEAKSVVSYSPYGGK